MQVDSRVTLHHVMPYGETVVGAIFVVLSLAQANKIIVLCDLLH